MFISLKNHNLIIILFIFFILIGCQLQEPNKNHGIIFLENRSEKLTVNKTNKNDVIKAIGYPHSQSINNKNEWIYIERILSKGEYYKLGQNILKANNILILEFDKYGILSNKTLLNKNDIQKIRFSKKITKNDLGEKSFVEKFLQSVKAKMYSNRDK